MLDELFKSNVMVADLTKMVIGDKIGYGGSREVYQWLPDPGMVLKVERGGNSYSNVMEWQTWNDAEHHIGDKEIMKWLAPVHYISPTGVYLLMSKTKPAPDDLFPEKIPVWMTDTKVQNFGLLKGKFVCHDYGNNLICNTGMVKRMKKADWWDEDDD